MFGDKRFSKIAGLSDRRVLPRLGKVRLGIKVIKHRQDGTTVEYPKEVPHFVVPKEVEAVYGERPTQLDVLIPIEDESAVFPQSLKWYVLQGLRCKGNREIALRRVADLSVRKDNKIIDDATSRLAPNQNISDPNALVEIGCPCPLLDSGDCSQNASLMILLPKVSMGGVYQITTGSIHNIVRLNSALDYTRALVGRIALVPLVLTRQEEEIQYEGKKAKHYLLQLTLNANLDEVIKLRENARMILTQVERIVLPAPVEDGPEPTGGGVVLEEEAEEATVPVAQTGQVTEAEVADTATKTVPVAQPGEVTDAEMAEAATKGQGNGKVEQEMRPEVLSALEQEWARVRELAEAISWGKDKVAAYCKEHYGPPKKMNLLKVQALVRHMQSITEK